jgi:alpha-amylase
MFSYLNFTPLIIAMIVAGCRQASLPSQSYHDDVFYEIWLKSFADSDDPDAIGDIKGIIEKLDYLNDGDAETVNDLGITGIKLSPIFDCGYKSPDPAANMHGYDVIDYDTINEIFGTRNDVKHLIGEAHKRGIKVLFDFVPNHTSSKHPWFLASKDNKDKRDWYIWETQPDTAWKRPWGGGSWQNVWFKYQDAYYYSAFQFNTLPDLNYKNKTVKQEIIRIIKYWLDFGFDGFRIDAARYIVEDGPGLAADRPGTHDFFKTLRAITDAYTPPRIMVAEIMATEKEIAPYFGNGSDELQLCYNFPFAWHVRESIQKQDVTGLKTLITFQQQRYPEGYKMAALFSNHDNLNSRPFSAFEGDLRQCLLAAALTLFSEGTPFLYYGNEIGLIGERGPEQFSDAALRHYFNWQTAEEQIKNPNSLWQWHRRLIGIRKQYTVLRRGSYHILDTHDTALLACLRTLDLEQMLLLYNFSNMTKQVNLSLTAPEPLKEVISLRETPLLDHGCLTLNSLPPYGFAVYYSGEDTVKERLVYPDTVFGGAIPPDLPRYAYETMYLRGSINQWRGDLPMKKNQQGTWELSLDLVQGSYRYKFEVAGREEWEINWGDGNGDGIGEIEGPPIELTVKKKGVYRFRFNEKNYHYSSERIENRSQL